MDAPFTTRCSYPWHKARACKELPRTPHSGTRCVHRVTTSRAPSARLLEIRAYWPQSITVALSGSATAAEAWKEVCLALRVACAYHSSSCCGGGDGRVRRNHPELR